MELKRLGEAGEVHVLQSVVLDPSVKVEFLRH